jgi:hypothetical protein
MFFTYCMEATMQATRLLLIGALLALGLSACAQPMRSTDAGPASASGEFFVDRAASPAAAPASGQGSIMAGIIENVNGNTLSLKRPMTGQTVSVRLTADTKILQQAEAQPSDIQKGDQVAVSGTQEGSIFQAEFMQIGPAGALGGGPISLPLLDSSEQPAASADIVSGEAGAISGTVEQVDGTTVTMKKPDGKTVMVQLAPHAGIRKQRQFGAEALAAGHFVIANGSQNGHSFEVSRIEVLPPPSVP